MNKPIKSTDRGDQTRSALIKAALAEFADKGFHAASTRLIAQSAQVRYESEARVRAYRKSGGKKVS